MEPSQLQLRALSDAIRYVCRSRKLSPDDAQDFEQVVHLKFAERGYDVFARHAGQSTLRTFLTVVVSRCLVDWQRARFGKWRPSAGAQRLGPHAVMLERLVSRDGLPPSEAIGVVNGAPDSPGIDALEALVRQVNRRPARHRAVELHPDLVPGLAFVDPIDAAERRAAHLQVSTALKAALRQLPPRDQHMLRARYVHRRPVNDIARSLGAEPAALYRHFDRVFRQLRKQLEAGGVTGVARADAP